MQDFGARLGAEHVLNVSKALVLSTSGKGSSASSLASNPQPALTSVMVMMAVMVLVVKMMVAMIMAGMVVVMVIMMMVVMMIMMVVMMMVVMLMVMMISMVLEAAFDFYPLCLAWWISGVLSVTTGHHCSLMRALPFSWATYLFPLN